MGPSPRGAVHTAENIDSKVRRLQRDVDCLVSTLTADERAAQYTYTKEAPALQDRIKRNKEAIRRLQRENDVERDKIAQLRNIYAVARERTRTSREQTPTHGAQNGAETEAATSQQQDSTEHDRPGGSAHETATPSPAIQLGGRRSTRQRRRPQHLSPEPPPTDSLPPSRRELEVSPASPRLPATRKRKRDEEHSSGRGQHGRAPQDDGAPRVSVTHEEIIGNKDESGKRRRGTQQMKAIEFDEVFGDGHASYKHRIFEHPEGSGDWFILRCDEHNTHFGSTTTRRYRRAGSFHCRPQIPWPGSLPTDSGPLADMILKTCLLMATTPR
ncbi:hypothetical protein NKR23_g12265 [Pleurostoma richardsiae]|uniref:Uncharacterized protein n=1 Tax=Pleurostoma richardsiae TaxID=41990 RepID=A0AA38VIS7_9PEZI|nr:hypothetical protein NKR23_g12265 [Pleurostoma richardsiae]